MSERTSADTTKSVRWLSLSPTSRWRRFSPGVAGAWITLLLSLSITGVAWQQAGQFVTEAAKDRFWFESNDIEVAIRRRMAQQEKVLLGGVALFAANKSLGRAEWRTYAEGLQLEQNYPGMQGFGFSLVVRPQDRAAHIQSVRDEGFPNYEIRPAGERNTYTSIIYLEPFGGRNLRAFGFDMFSEPTRRAAMERARDSGAAAISGMVTLV